MEKRIKVYSVVLALVYFSMIIYGFYSGIESFQAGYNLGKNSLDSTKSLEIHHFKVKPQEGGYTFPESVLNVKTGNNIDIESRECMTLMSVPLDSHSGISLIIRLAQLLFSFLFLFIFLFIPILFFKMIRSIVKGNILNKSNIRRVTIIGWLLVAYYIMNLLLYNWGETYITKQLVQLENYDIVYDFSDMTALILGIVTLLFSEILKFSLRLKEEQELTI